MGSCGSMCKAMAGAVVVAVLAVVVQLVLQNPDDPVGPLIWLVKFFPLHAVKVLSLLSPMSPPGVPAVQSLCSVYSSFSCGEVAAAVIPPSPPKDVDQTPVTDDPQVDVEMSERDRLGEMGFWMEGAATAFSWAQYVKVEHYLRLHPEALDVLNDADVLVVTGMPRTGTTFMQEALRLHQDVVMPSFREMVCPFDWTDSEVSNITEPVCPVEALGLLDPLLPADARSFHRIEIDGPAECLHALGLGTRWLSGLQTPQYMDESGLKDLSRRTWRLAFRRYRRMLSATLHVNKRLPLPSSDGSPRRPLLVLKNPNHLPYLADILAEFPSARFLWTHRDLAGLAKSNLMMINLAAAAGSLTYHPPATAMNAWEMSLKVLGVAVDKRRAMEQAWDAAGTHDHHLFADVGLADIISNPQDSVNNALTQLGLTPFDDDASQRLAEYIEAEAAVRSGGSGRSSGMSKKKPSFEYFNTTKEAAVAAVPDSYATQFEEYLVKKRVQ